MYKLILILAVVLSHESKAQNIISWDWNPNIVINNGQIMFRYNDPVGSGVAYVVYVTIGDKNKFSVVYLKQRDQCFMGNRTVTQGESTTLYYGVPCRQFNALDSAYEASLPTKTLEELNER